MNAPFPHAMLAAETDPPLIRFEGVTKTFSAGPAPVTALDGVDLDVRPGSIVGVIGRSGAGKSTLIRLVNGLERPSAGRVIVDGREIQGLDEAALREARRSIGMIFQHFNLLSSRTAADNVALPLELAGIGRAAARARVAELLDLVGLSDKADRYPAELSGGQKQRVGIARALATNPKVLLSDEATSALDPETTRSILDLLARINRELGLTILLITHEMAVIRGVAHEVAVLASGRIVEAGPVFDVFSTPRHPLTRAFLAGEPGFALPPAIAGRLVPEPVENGQTVIRVVFRGAHATEPVLARLARDEAIEANILAGTVDEIAGRPFGVLVVAIPSGAETAQALGFFARHSLTAEVVGHVA
ncbi:methionine ABC transporter ATP-binding protein [Salinarimonas soli]|uniref:Cell division ATP-binding protein FtsE n=1 Tax=Salinarimonas soli TaxID=1638099 RepID=A0A5B2V7H5_9HYPH|nr:methionine ABC transporter ATP-binding protein [Salinarimonas soli]KAA2234921.1 methionine ABC transporter ATP-binding protein [Salinarimonas soli]